MIAVIYGSTMGNTENTAKEIVKYLGRGKAEAISITEFDPGKLMIYSALILGASTWGFGELQKDWENCMCRLEGLNLNNKKIALFGCGDQESFPETFVDSLGIIYKKLENSGAEFIGSYSAEGYNFNDSKALIKGSFIGLPIDEENQPHLSEERIKNWVSSLGL